MRLAAIFSLVLVCACGRPVSDEVSHEPVTPIAHLAGAIGPVDEIDTDAVATIYDDGDYFSATVTADHQGTAVMARLGGDAATITVPMQRTLFLYGDDAGVSGVGCAGSAEGRWDIIDAPADVIAVEVDEVGVATIVMGLRDQTETVTASFSLGR